MGRHVNTVAAKKTLRLVTLYYCFAVCLELYSELFPFCTYYGQFVWQKLEEEKSKLLLGKM